MIVASYLLYSSSYSPALRTATSQPQTTLLLIKVECLTEVSSVVRQPQLFGGWVKVDFLFSFQNISDKKIEKLFRGFFVQSNFVARQVKAMMFFSEIFVAL